MKVHEIPWLTITTVLSLRGKVLSITAQANVPPSPGNSIHLVFKPDTQHVGVHVPLSEHSKHSPTLGVPEVFGAARVNVVHEKRVEPKSLQLHEETADLCSCPNLAMRLDHGPKDEIKNTSDQEGWLTYLGHLERLGVEPLLLSEERRRVRWFSIW